MAEVNVQKSSFFKEKKEESNTDFSLVKGALTENINRLEKLMNNSSSKYIQVKKQKKMHRAFSFVFLFNSKLIFYFFR
nr:stage II sporulation protein SB [Bacillus cereus]